MLQNRKLQIIKAADKRFSKHGLQKTTLDEVARDLRIGKATIYHYFQSKEDLYLKTLNWEFDLLLNDIKNVFSENISDKEKLIKYFELKENIENTYKLIHNVFILILKDKALKEEIDILNNTIDEEEILIKETFKELNNKNFEDLIVKVPYYLSNLSWSLIAGNKLAAAKNKSVSLKDVIQQNLKLFIR
ncbi:MAG: TetR/AcrR family transcriptional regulator [Syntrophothermus sp.]|nr:TetR/AcrR family transcriptional regulator [Ignavibacteriaceae bacterium]